VPLQSPSFASARSPPLRHGPFKKEPSRSGALRVSPLVGFLFPRTQLRRVPLSTTRSLAEARVGRGSPNPRRCRPQGSCPSRRFWLARGSLEVFRTPPFAVAPDASRPSFMPLASLELPCRAFPSRGAVPALASLVLPCGFMLDCRRRSGCRRFTVAFPCRASSSPVRSTRKWTRTHEPGRRSPRSLGRSPRRTRRARRTYRPLPAYTGLAG